MTGLRNKMIELFLTATIVWITNKTLIPNCVFEIGYPHACYSEKNNTIYISKEIKSAPRDFILYHEIGHSLFKKNFPQDLFKPDMWGNANYEVLTNDFGWWIYGKKHPKELKFTNKVVSQDKRNYFSSTCQKKCIDSILKLKIK
jgi:hypothetical protein